MPLWQTEASSLFQEAEESSCCVGRERVELSRGVTLSGFSYHYSFRYPRSQWFVVWTMPLPLVLESVIGQHQSGRSHLVSTRSTLDEVKAASLGVTTRMQRIRRIWLHSPRDFALGAQLLKSTASAIPPPPHGDNFTWKKLRVKEIFKNTPRPVKFYVRQFISQARQRQKTRMVLTCPQ